MVCKLNILYVNRNPNMRFAYIDQLKGLAMLMVVVTHLLQYSLLGTFVGGESNRLDDEYNADALVHVSLRSCCLPFAKG